MTPVIPANDDEPYLDRLREAWRERSEPGAMSGDCAEPASLWSAVRGDAPPPEARRLLLHAAACPACGTALRLAREIGAAAGAGTAAATLATGRRWVWAAAAAAVVALVTLPLWLPPRDRAAAPAYREPGAEEIRSLLPEDDDAPRDRLVLRWTPGPAGTRYTVRVTLGDLTPVASAQAIEAAEWQVPAPALAGLPPGAILFWRVEAHPPDGGAIASAAFRVRLR